jgi:uncharacterized cupredoxin-like copper-binding protein
MPIAHDDSAVISLLATCARLLAWPCHDGEAGGLGCEEVAMGWQPGNDGRRARPGPLAVLCLATAALALAGCSKGESKGQAASGQVVYKVSVQKFKYSGMPTSIKSGESIITLTNREAGPITHEFVLLALPSGKTKDDIVAAAKKKGDKAEGDFLSFGEVAEVDTGSTHAGVFSLPPGTYALACFEKGKLGGGEGPVHATIGMTHEFTVTSS